MRKTSLVVGVLALAIIAAIGAGLGIGGGEPEPMSPAEAALAVSHELMSPFCPGLTLAACPSPAAYDLRVEIRTRLEQGEALDAVTADLLDRYGSGIKGTPPASGLGLAVWLVPLVVGLGLVAAVRAVGRPVTREDPGAPASRDARLLDRLEDELDRMG